MAFDLHSYHWLLNFVQAFGVAATIMVQLHRGTAEESSYHGLFLTGLLLVALATIAQFATETSSCLFSACCSSACSWASRSNSNRRRCMRAISRRRPATGAALF